MSNRRVSPPRPVAGGGHAVRVAPEHLEGWFDRFAERHGGVVRTERAEQAVRVAAADGASASAAVPFPPLPTELGTATGLTVGALTAHAALPRTVGLILVRLGAHSVGIARGANVLVSSTDRHLVHGRSAAGGTSQQRFARRRDKQAREALARARDDAARVLLPGLATLEAVVFGGDRRACEVLRDERELAPLAALAMPDVLEVAEPRRSVLDAAAQRVRAVEITVHEPT
jgi:hypothetical protein